MYGRHAIRTWLGRRIKPQLHSQVQKPTSTANSSVEGPLKSLLKDMGVDHIRIFLHIDVSAALSADGRASVAAHAHQLFDVGVSPSVTLVPKMTSSTVQQ